jgi:hypothetical protein
MLAPLIAVLVALAPASTGESAPAPSATPAVASDALALAKLMSPRDLRIEGELKQFDLNFGKTLVQNAEVKAIEDKYPGTVDAMAKAVRPLLAEETGKIADGAYPQMARILADELTGAEIAELTTYYGSPAGRNLLRSLVQSMDGASIYAEALKNDGKVSDESASAETFIAAFKATAQLSPTDFQALRALRERTVWPKLQAVQPKIQKIIMDATNASDPAYDKQVEKVMSAAAEAHIRSLAEQPKRQAK